MRTTQVARPPRGSSRTCTTLRHSRPVRLGEIAGVEWLHCLSCGELWTRLAGSRAREHTPATVDSQTAGSTQR